MIEIMNKLKSLLGRNNYILSSQIKNTLYKSPTARNSNFDLTTLISRELLEQIFNGKAEGKILVGKKYKDLESGITFDILTRAEDFSNLQKINRKETPVVPYFSYETIKNPQEYFLSLNKQFPEINKILRGVKGNNSVLYRLIEGDSKEKEFTIGSYISLNGIIKSSP